MAAWLHGGERATSVRVDNGRQGRQPVTLVDLPERSICRRRSPVHAGSGQPKRKAERVVFITSSE
jgi:hypothetical protein